MVLREARAPKRPSAPPWPATRRGSPRRINSFNLWPGESVFLYTDGLTDARDEEGGFYGEDRLQVVLATRDAGAEQLAALAEESVTAFAGVSTSDDIAFVIARGLGAGST